MDARYTLSEANRLLTLIAAIADEIVERRAEHHRLFRLREDLERAATPEGVAASLSDLDARLFEHKTALRDAIDELEGLGLTVLRMQPLTIHIPGRTQGGPIVFCWQIGEDAIGHGHAVGEDDEPRRPLKVRSLPEEPGNAA